MTSTTSLSASATSAAATSTATCLDIKPGKNGYLPPEACDVILYYVPSFGAAIFFCVLYGLTTLVHLVQAIIYKKVRITLWDFQISDFPFAITDFQC